MPEKKEPKYKVRVPKLNATKKTYSFTLSMPGMISAVGMGVLALTFFFVMGILIGRGYRPEADVPPLQQIMPSKEHGGVAEKAVPEVLKPEELEYADRLAAPTEEVVEQPAPKPEPKPEPVIEKPQAAPKVEVTETETATPGEPVFDYVYQVASFRKPEMAEALSAKLVKAGLRTNISSGDAKGTTWNRVQVLHHGTPASTDDMKAVLARFGIKKPLLRKKTPVQ